MNYLKRLYISSKGQYINKKIMQKIFNEIFEGLDDYTTSNFNSLRFGTIDKKRNTFGICYTEEGTIIIDLIASYIYENKNKDLNMLMKNLKIVCHLLHEVEHLKQPSNLLKNNFESKLIRYSMAVDENSYDSFYDCVPVEKIAFAYSWKLILENISKYPKFKEIYFEVYKYVNNEYINNLKMVYYYDEHLDKYDVPFKYDKTIKCISRIRGVGYC